MEGRYALTCHAAGVDSVTSVLKTYSDYDSAHGVVYAGPLCCGSTADPRQTAVKDYTGRFRRQYAAGPAKARDILGTICTVGNALI